MKKHIAQIRSILAVLLLSSSILFITGCHKDDDNETPKTKTAMLTAGKWKLTAASIESVVGPPSDFMESISECFRDNLHEFKTDFKYVVSEGTNPCPGGDQSVREIGTWTLTENDTQLRFSFQYSPYGKDVYTVNTLTDSSMILILPDIDGTAYSLKLTFTKQ